jgi:DNA-binding response OmpR family regulator
MLPHRQEIASVVVCEDDAMTLDLLCDHLSADRFGVLPAPSASDALRLCRYNHPDLLLLDLSLPDASGLDVLREIREADGIDSRFDPRLPVIVLTGRSADTDRVRGLDSGADDYMTKPFRYEELRGSISDIRFHFSRAKNRHKAQFEIALAKRIRGGFYARTSPEQTERVLAPGSSDCGQGLSESLPAMS